MTERDSYDTLAGRVWIKITKEAQQALRARAGDDFKEEARPLKDGRVEIPLKIATHDRLKEQMLGGENYSDAILRILRRVGGTN